MAGKGKVEVAIELTGERQYNQAIKNINASQKELKSEMKSMETAFKGSANSISALTSKVDVLTRQYDAQAQKVKVYETAVANSAKKEEEAAQKVDRLTKEYEEKSQALEKLKSSENATTEEIAKQEKEVQTLSDRLRVAQNDYLTAQNATNKWQTNLNYANVELEELDKELKQNTAYLDEAKASTDGTAKSIDEFGNEIIKADTETNTFGDTLKANLTSAAIINAVKKLAEGIKEIAESCIEAGSNFEASMSKVEAVSGATGSELDALTAKAKEMGATTMFSASEAADAMNYMAMAGWKTEDMLSGIEGVMDLAAASGEDLATTSDIVTDALTAFGLSAEDTAHFADVLAAASSNANTNVAMMGETFNYCASIAGSLGFSVEDTAEAIGLMANAGIKSSQAGTSLRRIMTELSKDVTIHSKALGDMTIKTSNADGSMRGLSDILADCRTAFAGLTESEKASAAASIVGKNAMSGFLALMNAAPSDVEKLSTALENCDGVAKDMANTMQDNLKGKLTILQSALEALQISTYETFDGSLKEGVEGATDAVTRLNDAVVNGDLGVSLNRLGESLSELMTEVVSGVEDHLPQIIDGLTAVIDNADEIVAVIETLVTAWGTYKVTTEGAKVATMLLNAELALNPMLAVAAAVAVLTVGLTNLARIEAKENEQRLKASQQTSALVKESKSLNDTVKESRDTFAKSQEEIKNTGETCKGLVDELIALNNEWQDPSAEGFGEAVEKQKGIIAELKAAYPDLNLAIDEQTGALNMSTEAIQANIDAMQRQAQTAAAQERMTEIAKQKLELQTEQYKLNQQIDEQEKAYAQTQADFAQAQATVNAEIEKYGHVTEDNLGIDEQALDAKKEAAHELSNLKGQYSECQESIEELTGEEQILNDMLAENARASEQAGASAAGAADGFNQLKLTEEQLEEFVEAVNKSIDSQINLFEKFSGGAEQSAAELKSNLESQIEGLTEWEDNFDRLAEQIGGQGDALLQQLAQMGPAGNGYIKALLNMDDLQSYVEQYNEALKLKEEATSEIVNSYLDAGTSTSEAFVEGATTAYEEHGSEIAEAAAETVEQAVEEATDAAKEADKVGEQADTSTAEGIEKNADKPANQMEALSKKVVKTAETTMGKAKFAEIGKNIPAGLAQGVQDGSAALVAAVSQMAAQAAQAARDKLKIESPSKVFEEIGSYTAQGFIQGFESNTPAMLKMMSDTMEETSRAGASAVTTPSGMSNDKVAEAISDAIERGLSQFTLNVNADVDKDAIVRITVDDNNNYRQRKGVGRYV